MSHGSEAKERSEQVEAQASQRRGFSQQEIHAYARGEGFGSRSRSVRGAFHGTRQLPCPSQGLAQDGHAFAGRRRGARQVSRNHSRQAACRRDERTHRLTGQNLSSNGAKTLDRS